MKNSPRSGQRYVIYIESNTTGTGELFIHKTKQLGFRPLLVTRDRKRYSYSVDLQEFEILETPTTDAATVISSVQNKLSISQIAGVYSSSEYYVPLASKVAQLIGTSSGNPERIERIRDKSVQRELLSSSEPSLCPQYKLVNDVMQAKEVAEKIGFPVILKPVDGSGSVMVRMCSNSQEVDTQARLILTEGVQLLVEEMIIGQEISVETFNGVAVGVTKKRLGATPYFVELGHLYPAALGADDKRAAIAAAEKIADLLGINWGPAHIELRLSPHGPKLMELNPRLAGDMIPELIQQATGVDLISATILLVCGQSYSLAPCWEKVSGIRFLEAQSNGTLESIDGVEDALPLPHITAAKQTHRNGAQITLRGDFRDRVAYLIATAKNEETVNASLDRAVASLRVNIV
jgi:S-sulfo-L-cysteine synthase (3-phospho-L-serine-dependent)